MITTKKDYTKMLLDVDAALKDPLTVIKFLMEEIQELLVQNAATEEKVECILEQVEKMKIILKENTDKAQEE